MEANYFTILYWFCHTLTWICHGCTHVPNPEPSSHLPPHTIPLGHPSASALSILYPASNLDWRFVPFMILYMFQCHSPKSSPTSGTCWGLTSTFLLRISLFSKGECSRKLKCVIKPSLSNCTCKKNQFWNFKRVSSQPFSQKSKEYCDYIVLNYFVLVDRFKRVGWLLLLLLLSHFSRVQLCATA